ncbi:hypothetical protein BwSH20_64330 [Bradyrhizobium ottawaense]|nr:hypothetical protein TM233_20530 [Bradyrhizobium sp. TM233]GMO63424.1 hypothetical protein BwSG10_13330 [Bradyrhizobium ottawaense]GMO94601.1 hypothetical protein BwDG23_13330 [Bradyrhizobium ottawaense]GMP10892.1 hypothetical protein BwSH20_64330 [Bradyrhizobium ottawaense]GMP20614.1 hypothetical protein BwSH12_66200 [Bradyrhizobium ottawaense]
MASIRQIEANRANAKRSTGPRTEVGKALASRNARQHGLSRLNKDDLGLDALAGSVLACLGDQSSPSIARDLLEAKLWLSQIRGIRHGMLVAFLDSENPKQMKRLAGPERYERAARTAQRRALKCLRPG